MTATSSKRKVFVLAGEASGDLHGSHVVRKLVSGGQGYAPCDVVCWGGDFMAAAGGRLLSHYKERAIMGLWEVIRNLKKIRGFLAQAKADILAEKPDVLLLIDNPGFNLRIAKWAKAQGIAVHYYIAPKAWAWNTGRIKTMKRVIDRLYVIFPFEVSFFERYGMASEYVGNPIFEKIQATLNEFHDRKGWDVDVMEACGKVDRYVLLMPGSRKNEVRSLLPNFVSAARKFNPNAVCLVAGAPGLDQSFYDQVLLEALQDGRLTDADFDSVRVYFDVTYSLLMQLGDGALMAPVKSSVQGKGLALVASGTATLETALLGVPQVVAYRVNGFTYFMAKLLVKLRWVSLVNILLNQGLLVEHLQDVSPERLTKSLQELDAQRDRMDEGYRSLRDLLSVGDGSTASDGVFRGIAKDLYL